jgi:hypothetical protein
MAYSDFSLESIIEQQQLRLTNNAALFGHVVLVTPTQWLQETLSISEDLGLFGATEKARSEFIVAPILIEMERLNRGKFMVFSGKSLDVDKEKGLNGECDFILSRGEMTRILNAPILSIVEAKKQDLDLGLGQCSAQMVGAHLFNLRKGIDIPAIYGCVTTGDRWQFLKLEALDLSIDRRIYNHPTDLASILGIFQLILDQA